ncbi:glycoside hydrolase family 3 N-terminal domain-containing protein [Streptomyces plumbiresistens]|uniref:Glycoside hydrolase family 3 N-terminal domain-containing protein n=1 Tax=Streptomyces plumbiresistens TaxID=511811 RepID=A0ABP7SMQ8_9ACTN
MSDPHADGAVEKIVSRLTLEQKVAQLTGLSVMDLSDRKKPIPEGKGPETDLSRLAVLRPHGVGHLCMAWFLGHDADSLRSATAELQEAVREVSPFGIGAMIHNEAVNGFMHASGTQFPTAWAQAATWQPDLVRRAAAVSAAHLRDAGMQLALSPVMDLVRDPRWGRVHESYGEDPELVARFAVAFVSGMQGADGSTGVLATGKHFLGYGASEGGLNKAVTQLGRRALVDEYALPFRRAISEAGLGVIMNSYNEIDGIPAVANRWLFSDLLRGELGFDGLVVSDYDALPMLVQVFHTATTPAQAAVQSLTAGIDVDLPHGRVHEHLIAEVESGRLDEKLVDRAVLRVLRAKARVGLIPAFSPPPVVAAPDPVQGADLRRQIADRAGVLLSNDGTLPLTPRAQRVVVLGPAADEVRIHFGAYTSASSREMLLGTQALITGQVPGVDPSSLLFTDVFNVPMPGIEPHFEETTRALHPDMGTVVDALRRHDPTVRHVPLGDFQADPESLTPEAVAAAVADADVVVAMLGERTGWLGNNTAGENQSTSSPVLPGDQERLVELLADTGKTLVTVVVSGRPLLLEQVSQRSNALLLSPLLGEEGPRTVADTLYGVINPSGKLPSTFPRTIGQVPLYHGHHFGSGYDHPTGPRSRYNDLADDGPLYAFGHGLSYTQFELRFDETRPAPVVEQETITAHLLVSNTGPFDGETVVQLYVRDEDATVVRPVRQLVDFTRIRLAAGESRAVSFTVPLERLEYTLPDGSRGFEAGDITVQGAFAADDMRCHATIPTHGRIPLR